MIDPAWLQHLRENYPADNTEQGVLVAHIDELDAKLRDAERRLSELRNVLVVGVSFMRPQFERIWDAISELLEDSPDVPDEG